MAFELKNVVPWGRSLKEYQLLFDLNDEDLNKKIISFGDGPASFNAEMYDRNKWIVSLDPLYQFSKKDIHSRIVETSVAVMAQMEINKDNFIWKNIKDNKQLERIRMRAMNTFLEDFEIGKIQKRYVNHELPKPTNYNDLEFDLGLSSHFLILYSQLGLDFHLKAINEMLRVAHEVRIFPLLNLNGETSEVLEGILSYFSDDFFVNIQTCPYEFQKKGNRMLVITRQQSKVNNN